MPYIAVTAKAAVILRSGFRTPGRIRPIAG
jgi:hypothetical protein